MGPTTRAPVTAPAFTVVEKVLRAHGLPEMRRNAPDRLGGSRIRRDFENTEFGVVAEVDGVLGHDGFGRTLDARRDRKTLATGRVTARQTWVEVHYQSCELAADLLGILRSRRARRGIPAVHADLLGPPAPRRAPDLVRSLTVAMAAATLLTTPPSRLSDRRSSR